MNKQDNLELNNEQSVTEDLTVNEDQAKEVKGSGGLWQRPTRQRR